MIRLLSEVLGLVVTTPEGAVGPVRDFLFDDRSWLVKAVVAETDDGLSRKPVAIASTCFSPSSGGHGLFALRHSRYQLWSDPAPAGHIVSCRLFRGHKVWTGSSMAKVLDLVIDDWEKSITQLVVAEGPWWSPRRRLVSPDDIKKGTWDDARIGGARVPVPENSR